MLYLRFVRRVVNARYLLGADEKVIALGLFLEAAILFDVYALLLLTFDVLFVFS